MVRSVVELGDTIVREVMVPRTDMVFVERDKTLDQALSLALRSGFSRIPVTGESTDDVVGIAYLKDIVAWIHEHPDAEDAERVEKVMRTATYVPDSKPVDELLRQMQLQRIHVAIVIDEYGGTAGSSRSRTSSRRSSVRSPTSTTTSARPSSGWPRTRPGSRPPAGHRPGGALRRQGRRGRRGNGRRPPRARARPRPDRRLGGDGGGPAPHRGKPGRPPPQSSRWRGRRGRAWPRPRGRRSATRPAGPTRPRRWPCRRCGCPRCGWRSRWPSRAAPNPWRRPPWSATRNRTRATWPPSATSARMPRSSTPGRTAPPGDPAPLPIP